MLPKIFGTPLFCGHLQPKAAVFLALGGFCGRARSARGWFARSRAENFQIASGLGGHLYALKTAHRRMCAAKTKPAVISGYLPGHPGAFGCGFLRCSGR